MHSPCRTAAARVAAIALLMLALSVVGCHRGGPADTVNEPDAAKADIGILDDHGARVTTVPLGAAVFLTATGLPQRALVSLELRGPSVSAPPPAPAVSPQPPGEPPPGATPTPPEVAAKAETAPPAPAAPTEPGPKLAEGRYATDADGAIPATQVARALGVPGGPGHYAAIVRDEKGSEVGRATIEVVADSGPSLTASDATGAATLRFEQGEASVWASGRNLTPNSDVTVWVVADARDYKSGDPLDAEGAVQAAGRIDASGRLLAEVWNGPDRLGGFDLVLDADNSKTWTVGDLASGFRTTGFVVQQTPVGSDGNDVAADLASGEDYYTVGARSQFTSKDGLYIGGLLTARAADAGATVRVCAHRERWDDGALLDSRAPAVQPIAADPTGAPRVLAWPAPMLPGDYDVILDMNADGKYTRGVDVLDAVGPSGPAVSISDGGNLIALRGRVLDPAGTPLAGVEVTCADAIGGTATTDANGGYAFEKALPMPLRIQARSGSLSREIVVVPDASDSSLTAPDIVLGGGSPAADASLFPLTPGTEWKYDMDRTIEAEGAGKTLETGTLARSLAADLTLSETEEGSSEPEGGQLGEVRRTARWTLASEGGALLARAMGASATWLPTEAARADGFGVGLLRIGDYLVAGTAKLEPGGEVPAAAGKYAATTCVSVTLTGATDPQGTPIALESGSCKIWLAEGVGEVRREAELILAGGEARPRTTIRETLDLTAFRLPVSEGQGATP